MAPDNRDTEERIEIDVGHNALKMILASVFLFAVSVPAVMAASAAAPWIRGKMLALLWSVPAIFALLAVVGVVILYSVPTYIELDDERIRFGYILPVSQHSREILWRNISEMEDYGLITTLQGEAIVLGQLGADKEQIALIRERFRRATGRKEQEGEHLRKLAAPRARKDCKESISVEKRDPVGAIAFLGFGTVPSIVLAWAFYIGYTDETMTPFQRYGMAFFMLLISLITFLIGNTRLKKRTVRIGPTGVEYTQGRKKIFAYSWGELKVIKLYRNQMRYPRPHLMFQGLFEDAWNAGTLDSDDYSTSEFDRIVRVTAEYALCEGVRFEDHIGWPGNYDSSFKELFEIVGNPSEEEASGGPPTPVEVR